MISKKFKIIDPAGMHARPASIIVQEATKFTSLLTIKYEGKSANLKSIMSVMALVVKQNQEVEIIAEGVDEQEALKQIEISMKAKNLI